MDNEILKLKQYLLGNLSPRETEEIDLQLIADETLEEKLYWAESELAEDFLEGTLAPQETELFYKHFLVSPERENQLKHIAILKKYALDARPPEKSGERADESSDNKSSDNFFRRLKNFFAAIPRPAMVAALLIIVLLPAVSILYFQSFGDINAELTQLEKEYAEKNRGDLSNPADFRNASPVNLTPGISRDADSGNKLNRSALSEDLFFSLALEFEVADETLFNAQLLKDEKAVFRQNHIRVYRNPSGQEIRFFLPKSALAAKGQYQIRLENPPQKNLTLVYYFTVE